ncbi:kinetochore protein NDC80 [Tanacetum coccineum]
MICAENEELKMKVEVLSFNMRDVERMKRKLQAVKRDIGEAEIERNRCEEKCWDLNVVIGTKWKELEALQLQCNQAIRRAVWLLKLGLKHVVLVLKRVCSGTEMGGFGVLKRWLKWACKCNASHGVLDVFKNMGCIKPYQEQSSEENSSQEAIIRADEKANVLKANFVVMIVTKAVVDFGDTLVNYKWQKCLVQYRNDICGNIFDHT